MGMSFCGNKWGISTTFFCQEMIFFPEDISTLENPLILMGMRISSNKKSTNLMGMFI